MTTMKCYQCKEEIVFPSSNVRFKEPGKDEYVFLHNAEGKQCWRRFMLARVKAARLALTTQVQPVQPVQPVGTIQATAYHPKRRFLSRP
jgi:hypothetical protein